MQCLNIMIEDILDQGSTTRTPKEPPKKPDEMVEAALFKLTIRPDPAKLALPDILASAREQQDSRENIWLCFPLSPWCLLMSSMSGSLATPSSCLTRKGATCPFTPTNTRELLFSTQFAAQSREWPSGHTSLISNFPRIQPLIKPTDL